jgi:hypothetical protein
MNPAQPPHHALNELDENLLDDVHGTGLIDGVGRLIAGGILHIVVLTTDRGGSSGGGGGQSAFGGPLSGIGAAVGKLGSGASSLSGALKGAGYI